MENPRGNCAPALPGMVWYGMDVIVMVWWCIVGLVWYGIVWYNARYGMVVYRWYGMAWFGYGMVVYHWYGMVGMVQPSSQGKQTMLTPLPLLRVRLCCT